MSLLGNTQAYIGVLHRFRGRFIMSANDSDIGYSSAVPRCIASQARADLRI